MPFKSNYSKGEDLEKNQSLCRYYTELGLRTWEKPLSSYCTLGHVPTAWPCCSFQADQTSSILDSSLKAHKLPSCSLCLSRRYISVLLGRKTKEGKKVLHGGKSFVDTPASPRSTLSAGCKSWSHRLFSYTTLWDFMFPSPAVHLP